MTSQPDSAGATPPLRTTPPPGAGASGATQPLDPGATRPVGAGPAAPTTGGGTPQDAPLDQPWPPARPPGTPSSGPVPPMPPGPAPAQPVRRLIPAPTGANWALVVISLLLVLAATAEIAYLLGFRPDSDIRVGPGALIGAGGLLVLVGIVGLLGQRRSRTAQSRPHPDARRE